MIQKKSILVVESCMKKSSRKFFRVPEIYGRFQKVLEKIIL
jgi:hypothetical protein